MGGGGAGFIKDLDDVDLMEQKVTTNFSFMTNHVLNGLVSLVLLTGGGTVGSCGTWSVDSVGIHTTKNVGIGTTITMTFLVMDNSLVICLVEQSLMKI